MTGATPLWVWAVWVSWAILCWWIVRRGERQRKVRAVQDRLLASARGGRPQVPPNRTVRR